MSPSVCGRQSGAMVKEMTATPKIQGSNPVYGIDVKLSVLEITSG